MTNNATVRSVVAMSSSSSSSSSSSAVWCGPLLIATGTGALLVPALANMSVHACLSIACVATGVVLTAHRVRILAASEIYARQRTMEERARTVVLDDFLATCVRTFNEHVLLGGVGGAVSVWALYSLPLTVRQRTRLVRAVLLPTEDEDVARDAMLAPGGLLRLLPTSFFAPNDSRATTTAALKEDDAHHHKQQHQHGRRDLVWDDDDDDNYDDGATSSNVAEAAGSSSSNHDKANDSDESTGSTYDDSHSSQISDGLCEVENRRDERRTTLLRDDDDDDAPVVVARSPPETVQSVVFEIVRDAAARRASSLLSAPSRDASRRIACRVGAIAALALSSRLWRGPTARRGPSVALRRAVVLSAGSLLAALSLTAPRDDDDEDNATRKRTTRENPTSLSWPLETIRKIVVAIRARPRWKREGELFAFLLLFYCARAKTRNNRRLTNRANRF